MASFRSASQLAFVSVGVNRLIHPEPREKYEIIA